MHKGILIRCSRLFCQRISLLLVVVFLQFLFVVHISKVSLYFIHLFNVLSWNNHLMILLIILHLCSHKKKERISRYYCIVLYFNIQVITPCPIFVLTIVLLSSKYIIHCLGCYLILFHSLFIHLKILVHICTTPFPFYLK